MTPDSPRLRALDLLDPWAVGWDNALAAVARDIPDDERNAAAAILIDRACQYSDGPTRDEIVAGMTPDEVAKRAGLRKALRIQQKMRRRAFDKEELNDLERAVLERRLNHTDHEVERVLQELDDQDPRTRVKQGRFLTWDGLMAQEPPRWLVPGMIPVGSVGSVLGASQSLKTFFLIHVALSLCSGKSPFGDEPDDAAPTQLVLIVGEGASGIMGRMKAWAELYEVSQPLPVYTLTAPENLGDDRAVDALIEEIAALRIPGFRLLIGVDTLSANFSGDENGPEVTQFVRNCLRLSKELRGDVELPDGHLSAEDATVCFVHHLGKDKTRGARGHSSLHANVDFELTLERDDAKAPDSEIRTRIRCTKQKDGSTDLEAMVGADIHWTSLGKEEMPRDVLVMQDRLQYVSGEKPTQRQPVDGEKAKALQEVEDYIGDRIDDAHELRVTEIVKHLQEQGSERPKETLQRWVEKYVGEESGLKLDKASKDNANIVVRL